MGEKFFDILPPEKAEKIKNIPVVEAKKTLHAQEPAKKGKRGKLFLFLFLSLIFVIGGYFFVSSKIKIEISPKFKNFDYKLEIVADTGAKEPNLSVKVIPAYLLEQEKSASQSFFSSGKTLKTEKAKGIIRVYNNYELSQSLRENTRFMAASGNVFLTPKKIVVPGKKIENNKEAPGFIDVDVIASEPGPDYNIGPDTFSLPGLAGTILYTKLYGKSFEPMKGGFTGEASQVTQDDLQKAQNIVAEKLKTEEKNAIDKKIQESGFVLLEQAFRQEIKDAFSLTKAGFEFEKFNFSGKVESKALVFKKEDMDNLIKEFFKENLTGNEKLYEKSLKIDWKPKTIIFPDASTSSAGKIILDVEISAKTYFEILQTNLKKDLQNKDLAGAKGFLGGKPEISSFEIKSWPFWIKKMPPDFNKIDLKINLD
ncbi:MAG: hypothetical protein NTU58_01750 [Candidatus Nealsonbacteria bacterium]|nr:hypothetical protein [Candidatus Nealsonbacteria bacterium]